MAEVAFNAISSAIRFREAADARRERDAVRQASELALQTRVEENSRRTELAVAEATRTAQSIRDRRDDVETELSKRLKLSGQQQVLDSVDGDARYRQIRDDITSELNAARDDEAAILGLIESELAEALALDSIDEFRNDLATRPDFETFLTDRDERLTLRQIEQRDSQVQQRIDLRIADDNVRSFSPGVQIPRGSIVDVSG